MATVSKQNIAFQNLLKKLNFSKYFPQKLTLQDFLLIRNDIKPDVQTGTSNPHYLLRLILEHIKMANYQFRKVHLYEQTARESSYDADSDASEAEDSEEEIIIHPMDSLLALIHCADNFLRQDIFSKLVSCQVAIPLLLPDPPPSSNIVLPLWAMRSIVKSWKAKTPESTGIPFEERLVNCAVPMITFMRLSHPGFSKSKILNDVIDDSNHNFFFNYVCEGSSVERKFVDGLVEACWYLPAGEESDDAFDHLLMFTNLRGNASDESNSRQVKFLLDHSLVSFVFMLEKDFCLENLKKFQSSKGKIFFLTSSCSRSNIEELKQWVPNSAVIELAKREPTAIVKSIRDRISKIGTKSQLPTVFSQLSLDKFNIDVDEFKCGPCCKSRSKVEDIMDQIKGTQVKEEILPLQGQDLWHQWAAHNKSKHSAKLEDTGENTLDTFNEDRRWKMFEIRKEQCKKAKLPSEALSKFITNLLESSKEERAYFLQWLKFYLDDDQLMQLFDLREECKTTRDELSMNDTSEESRKQLQEKLKIRDSQLVNASFGIEHFFRELGQMYEAIMEVENDRHERSKVKQFPKIVAELLLSGQPFEIVDGDAGHIPIKWVQAILNEVKVRIKNCKVYTLSVLGIQSTGKSTLMNTMFGVQFPVSAGRCTRGAYLHLLGVQAANSKCDYMLIIDTEGLRAPEFDYYSQTQHDNELAALVIGLADVTIVNMFGEVPADISDILQTTVHAFIRMKKAEMEPSCQFVRHHVASVSASKTREGIDKFQETLNRMTAIAAKAEHCEGQFERFSDVIKVNNDTDIHNFHNLWHGNPPMAPVNPLYCKDADTLRSKLLQLAACPSTSLCSLRDFQIRLDTLWEAILKENFVFSFKNTLEVEAFSCLDTEYGKWSWELQSCYVKWEGDAVIALSSTSSLDTLLKESDKQIQKIHKILEQKFNDIMKSVEKFFASDNNRMIAETMIQWRSKYEIKMCELKNDCKKKAMQYCEAFIERRRAKSKVDEMKKDEREKIERKLKHLISETAKVTNGTKLSPEELEIIKKKFDKQWEEWMREVERAHPPPQALDIHGKITYCLRNDCGLKIYDKILVEEEKKKSLDYRGHVPLKLPINERRHINNDKKNHSLQPFEIISISQALVPEKEDDPIKFAEKKTHKLLCSFEEKFTSIKSSYEDYHIVGFVRDLLKAIDDFESSEDVNFTFTAEYRVDLIMEVAGYALKMFLEIQQSFIYEHPIKYLESLRPIYEQKFNALYNVTVQEKALAISLLNLVEAGMTFSLKEKIKGDLPEEVRASHSFFDSKKSLTGHVLQSLLRKESFDEYKLYLQDISQCFYNFIREYTEEYCNTQENGRCKIVLIAESHLERKMKLIQEAAKDVESSCEIEEWLTKFHKNVSAIIRLKEDDLKFVLPDDPAVLKTCDVKFFTEEFINELDKCHFKIKENLSDPYNETLQVLDEVAKVLRDSVAGCCEQCPFCKEQCEVLTVDHVKKHHCSIHRPQCLGGFHYILSDKMVLESCTELVASKKPFRNKYTNDKPVPYKQYHTIYPDWRIPEGSRDVSPYWKWFIVNYKDEIAKLFGHEFPSIAMWKFYTKKDAERFLKRRYQLND